MSHTLKSAVDGFAKRKILVIGDVILDEYISGRPTRVSREAPVPVLELESKRYIAGGAANPAANVLSLGGRAVQVGVIGEDEAGARLMRILEAQGIDVGGIVSRADRPTTVKTRILAQMGFRFPQQVTRIDTLTRRPIDGETESRLIELVGARLADVDAALLSHYDGGLLGPALVQRIRALCRANDVLLTADVQGAFDSFSQLDVIKCNADDARRYLNRELETDADFSQAARQLYDQLGCRRAAIITRGARGATLAADGESAHCPAPSVSDVFDTVGAGDTAIATLTLALAAGASASDAVRLANIASGIVVRYFGNYTPSQAELRSRIEGEL